MTYGSLFSGIGGLDLGLDRAGLRCRFQVEIDPFARKILHRHWPGVTQHGDITQLSGSDLGYVDLLCGGFPCQDLSYAGKQKGIEGSRSGLWFEYSRLIGEIRPRYVVIENVPGLLVHDAMRRVIGELAQLGYVGIWRCFRASEFGASHLRKRVFIVAVNMADSPIGRRGELREPSGGNGLPDGSREKLADAKHKGRRISGTAHNGHGSHASGDYVNGCDPHMADAENDNGWRRVSETQAGAWQGGARWRGSAGSGDELPDFAPGPSDPRWHAILRTRPDLAPALESPLCGVADGLPDWLDRAMSNRTKRLSRLGNAVVPEIAEYIGRIIMEFDNRRLT